MNALGDAGLTGAPRHATLSSSAQRAVASGLLSGHHVLVTGAASGIGKAVAELCRAAGATVTGADLTEGDDIFGCDVRNEQDVAALFATAGDTLGDVAGVGGAAINWSMTERTASPAL